ncbi:MAG: hypothetical protein LRY39_00385 [Alphaproteobacteria bacterium]|nr:hypothetical protein [Alphaproteobacteria bacterium]
MVFLCVTKKGTMRDSISLLKFLRGTENVEEKAQHPESCVNAFSLSFLRPGVRLTKNAPPLNLDKVRKSLHALQKQIIKNDTEHGLEPSGITPEFTQKAITVAAPYNKRLESLRAKMQQMTKFLPNGQLLFDQATSETWELTPGQDAFVKAFPHKAALIVKGPAVPGKRNSPCGWFWRCLPMGKSIR